MYFLCHFQLISKPRLGSGAGGGGGRGRARAAAAQSLIMCTIFRSSIMVNNLLLFETGNRKRLFLNNKIKFWLKKRGKNKIGKKLITYKKDLYSHRKLQRILKLFSCCWAGRDKGEVGEGQLGSYDDPMVMRLMGVCEWARPEGASNNVWHGRETTRIDNKVNFTLSCQPQSRQQQQQQ